MPAFFSEKSFIIGPVGSDAGYIVWGPNGFHHVGGWAPEAMAEVTAAVNVLGAASQLSNHAVQSRLLDVANAVLKPHIEYIQKALQDTNATAQVAAE